MTDPSRQGGPPAEPLLDVEVAVLDERGTIVAVNDSWTAFTLYNGGDPRTCGVGANYLGIGGNVSYRQDIVSVALRAVSVQTGRVLASVTTTKTIYSTSVGANAFQFAAVDALLQADIGVTKNSPATLAVREGIQLAVYSLIFEGVKNNLWEFSDRAAGAAFMRELELHRKALPPPPVAVVAEAPLAEPVVVTKN